MPSDWVCHTCGAEQPIVFHDGHWYCHEHGMALILAVVEDDAKQDHGSIP